MTGPDAVELAQERALGRRHPGNASSRRRAACARARASGIGEPADEPGRIADVRLHGALPEARGDQGVPVLPEVPAEAFEVPGTRVHRTAAGPPTGPVLPRPPAQEPAGVTEVAAQGRVRVTVIARQRILVQLEPGEELVVIPRSGPARRCHASRRPIRARYWTGSSTRPSTRRAARPTTGLGG